MSDSEEYEYEYDSDEQFGNSDEEIHDESAIEIENTFYEADDTRNENPALAIELLDRVVLLETQRGDEVKWRFKALEHLVTLHFCTGNLKQMLERYKTMLGYMNRVTRNECTDSINSILDTISSGADPIILAQMYEVTLNSLRNANNERLWFNTNVKLGKIYLDLGDFSKLSGVIEDLHKTCLTDDGRDDQSKATYLLDVYALEIQVCTATKNSTRMKEIYPKTLDLDGAIADPRIMGVVREEGGKMYMTEAQWTEAYNEFFEGFRNYQEAGNTRAKNCLKYVVLASMLACSDINPFDSREAKVYQDDNEINSMILLRSAYESNEITRFEEILRNPRNKILDDPYIMTYLEPLLNNIRSQVLLQMVKPYQCMKISTISEELNISEKDVESLCVELILNNRSNAKIDQVNGYLVLGGNKTKDVSKTYQTIKEWIDSLESLSTILQSNLVKYT